MSQLIQKGYGPRIMEFCINSKSNDVNTIFYNEFPKLPLDHKKTLLIYAMKYNAAVALQLLSTSIDFLDELYTTREQELLYHVLFSKAGYQETRMAIARLLFDYGVNPSGLDENNNTPMYHALSTHWRYAELLIVFGCMEDVKRKNSRGRSLLMEYISKCFDRNTTCSSTNRFVIDTIVCILHELFDDGSTVNASELDRDLRKLSRVYEEALMLPLDKRGNTIVHRIMSQGSVSKLKCLQSLSQCGIPVPFQTSNQDGMTPLMIGITCSKYDAVNEFLESVADTDYTAINTLGQTAAHLVPVFMRDSCKAFNCFEQLKSIGCPVDIPDISQHTPIHYAILSNIPMMYELIMSTDLGEEDNTITVPEFPDGIPAEFKLLQSFGSEHQKSVIVSKMISNNTSTVITHNGSTLLHAACEHQLLSVASVLLNKGYNINMLDMYGQPCYQKCIERGDLTSLKLLFEQTDDIQIDLVPIKIWSKALIPIIRSMPPSIASHIVTKVMEEESFPHLSFQDYLLQWFQISPSLGMSILHIACYTGNIAVFKVLMYQLKVKMSQYSGNTKYMSRFLSNHIDYNGNTILHLIFTAKKEPHQQLDIIHYLQTLKLMNVQLSSSQENYLGETPVYLAHKLGTLAAKKSVLTFLHLL
jgi:ankyrin repeat protein